MHTEEFENILRRHKDTVFRLAYSNLGNRTDAEDISQEVFISLLDRESSFETSEAEKAWLIRVTINKCHDLRKSAWHRKRVDFGGLDIAQSKMSKANRIKTDGTKNNIAGINEQSTDNYENIEPEESLLGEEVMRLPLKYRNVIHLYYYEGYSVAEIGSIMGRKNSTIQTWLQRARQRLKEKLDGKEIII